MKYLYSFGIRDPFGISDKIFGPFLLKKKCVPEIENAMLRITQTQKRLQIARAILRKKNNVGCKYRARLKAILHS